MYGPPCIRVKPVATPYKLDAIRVFDCQMLLCPCSRRGGGILPHRKFHHLIGDQTFTMLESWTEKQLILAAGASVVAAYLLLELDKATDTKGTARSGGGGSGGMLPGLSNRSGAAI